MLLQTTISSSPPLQMDGQLYLSHFHSLLPFGSLKLKPHKLSLQAIFQLYGAPVLITSKTGYGPNLTRFPKFQVVKVEGHGADDVVATLAAQVLQRGYRVVIASPDKDFKQLISEDVQIVMPLEDLDRWSIHTLKHYIAQYNCDPCCDLSLNEELISSINKSFRDQQLTISSSLPCSS